MESLFLFFQLQKGIKIDANQSYVCIVIDIRLPFSFLCSPLFIGAAMLLKETQFDCLNTYKKLLELMLANACTIEDLKVSLYLSALLLSVSMMVVRFCVVVFPVVYHYCSQLEVSLLKTR